MEVYGGLTIFGSGYVPGHEVNPVLDFEYSRANASLPTSDPFHLTGSVSFTVDPGDSFYVWANLSAYANASHQVTGSVDALHTLSLSFTTGDTSLLSADVAAVPEPSTLVLVAGGLGLGAAARRRGVA